VGNCFINVFAANPDSYRELRAQSNIKNEQVEKRILTKAHKAFIYLPVMKEIYFTAHALANIPKRGFTREEVIECIRTEKWEAAEIGKSECRKNFVYNKEWNGKLYATKQVRPIFADEEKIIVITVYTYYF